MQLGLRSGAFRRHGGAAVLARSLSWSSLWRGGVLALAIVFAVSTQLLFQLDLYQNWPLGEILLGWSDYLIDQLIVGVCVFAAVAFASLVRMRSRSWEHALVLVAITVGAAAGEAIIMARLPLAPDLPVATVLVTKTLRWIVIAGLAYALFVFQRAAAQAAAELHESELERIQANRQLTEAHLESLHAQIEPHFLFNTLATLQRLYRTDADRGRRMLASFVAYVRAALPQMNAQHTTLKQEVELAKAYLDVLQVRMGDRLKVRFDIPPALATLAFPPLTLSTLTENAIKHGLNPLPDGGCIEISAHLHDARLEVVVADTGAGLRHHSGSGSGLANLRARLHALYGDTARLELRANVPRGIRAMITVPAAA